MPPKKHARIVIIHGARFRRKDKQNLRKLATAFVTQGFDVVLPSYGYLPAFIIGLFMWLDRRIAQSMSGFIRSDDILVGHSNGATLVYLVSQYLHIRGAVLINAALDHSLVPNATFTHVYFNSGDMISRLSGIVPFHIWGDMGTNGYVGTDVRVRNIDQANPPAFLPPLHGHSDLFEPANIRAWSCYISAQCLKELEKSDIPPTSIGDYDD